MAEVWRWWPQSITEALEFATDVRSTFQGEWRDSLKDATQFLTLGHTLRHARAEALIEAVRANALGEWLVPEWPNATLSAGTLAAAAVTVPVAVPAAYRAGQTVFIGTSDTAWETRVVDSVGLSSITLTTGLGATYTGTDARPIVVAPVVPCIAPGGVEFQTVVGVQGLSMRFMSIDPIDIAANAYPLHDDRPVVTDGARPFQPLAGALNQAGDLMASGFGAYELQAAENFARRRTTLSWFDKGAAARFARRQFLHFLRGRDGEFWVPSGQRDLVLQSSVSSGALSITVAPVASNAAMVGRLIVLREGASIVAREVVSATSAGANQVLEIAAPGVAFSAAAIVSMAVRSRLDADTVELSYFWAASGLASLCSVPAVEVP